MTIDNRPSLKDIYDAVGALREDIANNYVSKDAFEPVKNLVYGLVAVILLTVVGAIVALVVHSSTPTVTPKTTVQVTPSNESN